MQVFHQIKPLKEFLRIQRCNGDNIGFVPTMGALHEGHISLVKQSIAENNITICSIYVNPVQFNDASDLLKYPRTLESDLEKLKIAGCDVVFCPSDNEVYGKLPALRFDFQSLDKVMEGKYREGHFNGVGIVVSKLFNMVNPDKAYFGQKDLQQFIIIKNLVEDLSFDVELICAPIVRENDGLAMSSRNVRLTSEERIEAGLLYKSLQKAKSYLLDGKAVSETISEIKRFLLSSSCIRLDYFEVVESNTLKQVNLISKDIQISLCIAAFVGEVRLIDNIFLHD
jgi:pantoate--beta-alanine ligase